MNEKLRIPERLKVGFQKRDDTYTGKLAYVISGGRKKDPISWDGWRNKKIAPQEFDNVPIEGFVLNRDVGGTQRSYDWNARRERVRVYDPRDFEFEITVENVLLILQECSSIKGKGLEGEFVLAWSGSHVVLLPVCSQEYKTAVEFIELGEKKVAKTDIIEGYAYLTKNKENVMYLGRHAWFDRVSSYNSRWDKKIIGVKKHIFFKLDESNGKKCRNEDNYAIEHGFTKLAKKTSDAPLPQFAEEYEKLLKSIFVSIPKVLTVDKPEICERQYGWFYGNPVGVIRDNSIYWGMLTESQCSRHYIYGNSTVKEEDMICKYDVDCEFVLTIKNGELIKTKCEDVPCLKYSKKDITIDEVKAICKTVYIECENKARYKL